MANSQSNESERYAELGASSSKDGVHKAIGLREPAAFFAEVKPDVTGDDDYYSLLHADGAGTKSILAYLAYKETNDVSWFSGIAQDSFVMNLDDLACVNAFEGLLLSNTIGRNRFLVPDSAIQAVITGYKNCAENMNKIGIPITLAGGETADMGDVIRTLVLDSTLFARVKKSQAVSTNNIANNDIIIGLSGTGQASYEDRPNSSIGSNGITLARHALLAPEYKTRFPEVSDPQIKDVAYAGKYLLTDKPAELDTTVAEAILSPTRTYAPILKKVCEELKTNVHGIIHCSGGGQTKIINFGRNKRYIKNDLFECPAIFNLIQESGQVPWKDMYSVFNMGHRMEIICPAQYLSDVKKISESFGVDAKQIGFVEDSEAGNQVQIKSPAGEFHYS